MTAEPTPAVERVVEFLHERGAGEIQHPGGDLLHHLLRTHELLRGWNASEPLSLAGLCHAAYGTDGFPMPLLDLTERDQLRAIIGERAEAIVHTYCACARGDTYTRLGETPLRLADRFTGGLHPLGPDDASAFALLTIADELDVARVGDIAAPTVDAIGDLVRALSPYAPVAAAQALTELRTRG